MVASGYNFKFLFYDLEVSKKAAAVNEQFLAVIHKIHIDSSYDKVTNWIIKDLPLLCHCWYLVDGVRFMEAQAFLHQGVMLALVSATPYLPFLRARRHLSKLFSKVQPIQAIWRSWMSSCSCRSTQRTPDYCSG